MTRIEKKYIKELAVKAWKDLKFTEEYTGNDSLDARAKRAEWFAYNKICKKFGIEYDFT